VGGLRVIGHPKIVIAALAGRFDHLFERIAAIRLIGVGVENAADVRKLHQLGNATLLGERDLAAALSQFRFDVLQAEHLVDASLRLRRDDLATSPQAALVETKPLALGQPAKLLQMRV
jgi:hypothetical protein